MADYTVTLGPKKEKLLKYFYPDVDTGLDTIITRALVKMLNTAIRKETEYRVDLSPARKQAIIDAIEDLPTYAERMAAITDDD